MSEDDNHERGDRPATDTPEAGTTAASGGDDVAGPLMGWSLETGIKQQSLADLVEFPCVFTFKTVGVTGEAFLPAVLETVHEVLGRTLTDAEHSVRESAKGKYTSVTLEVPVSSSEEVYSLYKALGQTRGVKFVL